MNKNHFFSSLKYDLPASIVVFLVAVPLCLGIALASGAPLMSGLIAGIIGGIVTGILSDSSVSVSGPAAGLAAVVLSAISTLGSFPIFLTALVIAGFLQLAMGFLKAGSIANYFPSNVIKGMLTGIGAIIILKQIPHALGYDSDAEGDLNFWQPDGNNTFGALLEPLSHIHLGAAIIALVGIAILVLWDKFKPAALQVVPGALLAVAAGILLNFLFNASGSPLAVQNEHLVQIPVIASLADIRSIFASPDWSSITSKGVWIAAFTMAAVASIETLLCIEATDKLDPFKRHTSQNRELKAQGISNILCGLVGGLPVTSVIVRSTANVSSGARTKISTIAHGFLILICVFSIPSVLNKIPLASLAAILLIVGYKLCNPVLFKNFFKEGYYQFIPFIVTVLAVVLTDLLSGVTIGLIIAIFFILRENLKNAYFFHRHEHENGQVVQIDLAQEVSFLNKANIKLTLDQLSPNTKVIINAANTEYIDFDVQEIINDFKNVSAKDKNIEVVLLGFKKSDKVDNTHHLEDGGKLDTKELIPNLFFKS